ncbi:MAG: hypothetical protein IPM13_16515 [Phycisphaerales bacterium]|nr:hypothetical protein [Phycisphaerales bacterium]
MLVVAMDRLDSSLALLLGGFCLVMLVVSLARASMTRRASLRDLTRAERKRLRDEHALAASLEVLIAQAQETADAVAARTEAAARRLERLVASADQRIEALRGLAARGSPSTTGGRAEPVARASVTGSQGESGGTSAVRAKVAESGTSQAIQENKYAPDDDSRSGEGRTGSIGLAQAAGQLAAAGHSVSAIAEAMGLTVGEVDVLLGLHAITDQSQRERPQLPKAVSVAG